MRDGATAAFQLSFCRLVMRYYYIAILPLPHGARCHDVEFARPLMMLLLLLFFRRHADTLSMLFATLLRYHCYAIPRTICRLD